MDELRLEVRTRSLGKGGSTGVTCSAPGDGPGCDLGTPVTEMEIDQ